MKKRQILLALLTLIVPGLLLTACQSKQAEKPSATWTAEEETLVRSYNDSIMRLWLVESASDSLFLRQACTPLTREDVADTLFQQLKHQMLLTVTNPENEGVGIAAPQVGIGRRLVAVQRLDKAGEPFEFYINPRFTYLSPDKQTGWEGCLSIPGRRGKVQRSTDVVLQYNDETTFELCTDTVRGFTAIIFQHELDHLDGTLYTDRADTVLIR